MRAIALITLFSILSSCAPATRTTVFQNYSPRPDDHPIKIFRHKMPKCEYEEIGIVSARQRNKLISMNKVMNSLQNQARKLGGDAIIGFTEANPVHNISGAGIDRDPVLSGTVIRFKRRDCRE